ncbi:MAG: GspH/FimT family pseudopilin [Pirellulaceae bacterium]
MPLDNSSRGFTLVELLVTITILAIAAAIAIPSLVNIVRDNRVSAQANEFVVLFTFARSEAVKRRGDVSLVIEAPNESGWSAEVCVNPNCDGPEDPIRAIDHQGRPVSATNPGRITFTTMGRVTTNITDSTVVFQHSPCSGQQRREIAVAPSGLLSTDREPCE